MSFVIELFTQLLLQLYSLTGSLGWSILAFTLVTRLLLFPLSLSMLKSQKKIREIQPELKKLKDKHGTDKQAFQAAQLELYKKYNINPLNGCLPQLVQIGLFILLYQVLTRFLHQETINGQAINTSFLWLNLVKPDSLFILPVVTALTQLALSVMILPATETPDIIPNKSRNKDVKKANEKEEDMAEMAMSMQKQMLFIMPLMTGFMALKFPSGVVLYWIATTVFSVIQQYYTSGWGGWLTYTQRAKAWWQQRKI